MPLQGQLRVHGLDTVPGKHKVDEATTQRWNGASDTAHLHALEVLGAYEDVTVGMADKRRFGTRVHHKLILPKPLVMCHRGVVYRHPTGVILPLRYFDNHQVNISTLALTGDTLRKQDVLGASRVLKR